VEGRNKDAWDNSEVTKKDVETNERAKVQKKKQTAQPEVVIRYL